MLKINAGLILLWWVAAVTVCALSSAADAQTLRYKWQDGQKFSYQFDIKVDGDDETTTYSGITNYTVDKAGKEQMRVTYRGGLTESVKSKQSSRGRPGFPIPFGGPPRMMSPFSKPTFAGKTQTTNKITLTPRGNVLAMDGDSHLPYLLGNLSLIPFETLPENNERQWKVDSGVSITEEDENRRHRFGPFDPFASDDTKSVQAAGELTTYAIQSTSNNLVQVKRTYKLTTPETKGNAAFDMTGTGTWTFDTKDGIPHSLEMRYQLIVKEGNTSTTVPVSVAYTRISAEKLAEMEANAKKRADEMAATAAAAKAKAEAPLTVEEKKAALVTLASGIAGQVEGQLAELAAKKPLEPDAEVAAAIEKHLDSPDKKVASAAHKAMLNWSSNYKLVKSLEKAYQGPAVLKSTGRVVESITPLYVGQIVQAQRKNRGTFWFAAKIEELMNDGQVKLGFLTWGDVRGTEVVERRRIQLAPEELPQPNQPAGATAEATMVSRTWSDVTGRFNVDAVFVGLTDGAVSLRLTDKRVIKVPLAKLSASDQEYVEQLQKSENPFAVD